MSGINLQNLFDSLNELANISHSIPRLMESAQKVPHLEASLAEIQEKHAREMAERSQMTCELHKLKALHSKLKAEREKEMQDLKEQRMYWEQKFVKLEQELVPRLQRIEETHGIQHTSKQSKVPDSLADTEDRLGYLESRLPEQLAVLERLRMVFQGSSIESAVESRHQPQSHQIQADLAGPSINAASGSTPPPCPRFEPVWLQLPSSHGDPTFLNAGTVSRSHAASSSNITSDSERPLDSIGISSNSTLSNQLRVSSVISTMFKRQQQQQQQHRSPSPVSGHGALDQRITDDSSLIPSQPEIAHSQSVSSAGNLDQRKVKDPCFIRTDVPVVQRMDERELKDQAFTSSILEVTMVPNGTPPSHPSSTQNEEVQFVKLIKARRKKCSNGTSQEFLQIKAEPPVDTDGGSSAPEQMTVSTEIDLGAGGHPDAVSPRIFRETSTVQLGEESRNDILQLPILPSAVQSHLEFRPSQEDSTAEAGSSTFPKEATSSFLLDSISNEGSHHFSERVENLREPCDGRMENRDRLRDVVQAASSTTGADERRADHVALRTQEGVKIQEDEVTAGQNGSEILPPAPLTVHREVEPSEDESEHRQRRHPSGSSKGCLDDPIELDVVEEPLPGSRYCAKAHSGSLENPKRLIYLSTEGGSKVSLVSRAVCDEIRKCIPCASIIKMPNFDLLEVDLIWPALQKAATEDPEFTSSNFDRAHVRIDSVRFKIVEELEEGILMSRKALEHHQLRICDDGDIVEMFSSENPLSRILLSKLMPGARVLTQAPPRIFRNGSESRANGDGNEQAQELPPTSKGTLEARKEDKLGPKHKEGGRKEVQEEREQMEHDNDDSGEEFPESLSLLDRISADQTVRSVSKPKPKAPSKDLTRKVHGSHTSPEDADTAKVAKGKRNAATGSFDANLYVLKDSSSLRSRISDNPSNSKRQRVALIPSDQNYGQNDHRKISNGSERRSIQTSGERWYQPKKFGTGEEAGEATRKWPHRDPRHAYSAYESVYVSEDPMDEESQLYRETSDLNPEEIKQASAKSRQILREMQQRRRLQAKAAAVPAERSDSPVPTDPVIPDGVCERGDPSSQYLRKQRDSSSSQERPPPPGPPPPKPFHRSPDWQGVRMPRTSEPRGSQASRHHGRSSTYSVSSSALRYGQRYDPSWSYRKDSLGAIDPDYYRTRNRQNSRNWQNANFYE